MELKKNRKKLDLASKIDQLPEDYTTVKYQGKKYGVSKSTFNSGKSIKVYAEELGGNDVISFNFYKTMTEQQLKPCEMSKQKVIDFLRDYLQEKII